MTANLTRQNAARMGIDANSVWASMRGLVPILPQFFKAKTGLGSNVGSAALIPSTASFHDTFHDGGGADRYHPSSCGWRWARRQSTVVILIVYLLTSVGLPAGDWTRTGLPQPGISPTCRCSMQSQRTGRCCCARSTTTGPTRKCCSSRDESAKTQSCCGITKKGGAGTRPKSRSLQSPCWKGICDCGPGELPTLLTCREPRILPSIVTTHPHEYICRLSRPVSMIFEVGERTRPPLPPPRMWHI